MSRRPRETKGRGDQTLPGLEGAPALSSATLRILASMPSRTIGRSRGAIISQYYNRTVRLRRRSSRPLLGNVVPSARPSLRLYDLELDSTILEEDEKRSLLVKELQGLSAAQRDHMVRNMPLSLGEKRCLREKSWSPKGKRRHLQGRSGAFSCCSRLRYTCMLALHSLGLALLSGLYAARPWRYALKQIGGQFGSSVLSYFLFLKTLLAFNALMLLPLLAFLVGVQAAFPPDPAGPVPTFSGLELLTGGGRFTHTVMYYGYYSNSTLSPSCDAPREGGQCSPRLGSLPYNMPLAYLFTMGATFFLTCIILVYSLMANCQAPRRPWLASHMSTVFLTLLCFPSFLGAAVFLCYAVWQVRPSSTCGPFRTLNTMYEAGTVWVRRLEHAGSGASWLPWLHHFLVENTFFLFLASALLLKERTRSS